MPARLALDHLVVAAATLEQGAAWCEATLGVLPGPGGKHPLMGTHNRLLRLQGFERAYLEIIAIDPDAAAPGRVRWFDLDDEALLASIRQAPRLIHWVARCDDLDGTLATWRHAGIERGEALAASRDTPAGVLRWRIAVRPDGRRLHSGALPTLIEWGEVHPADTLPESAVRLESLALGALPDGLEAIWPPGVMRRAAPGLAAQLRTPRGGVVLESEIR
jgi:hypothetical protein